MRHIATFFIAWCAGVASAGGLSALETFVRGVRSGEAEFEQTVTSPARAGETPRQRSQRGSFAFQRPERFRFDYRAPFEQHLVADGRTLWLHDPDLNQVTARDQATTLAQTPAALIAAASDLQALKQAYTLADAPDADGLQWVLATPRATDSTLRQVRLGFRAVTGSALPELAVLEMQDALGQDTRLRFSQFRLNPALPAQRFQFTPPAGADVVRSPR